jgi:flagellar biosynthesis/type III secretory pathway chaperone
MEREQLIKAFAATVQASLHGLQLLEPVLRQEQAALTGKDPERLEAVVEEKLGLLKQLEPSVQARDRLQRAAGLAEGLADGDRLVESLGQEPLTRDWAEMNRLAGVVAELNDRNSQLVMQGQRATRTALGILTGRSMQDDTYTTLRRRGSQAALHTLAKI